MDSQPPSTAGQDPSGSEPLPVGADERELISAVLHRDRKAAARFVAAHVDAVYGYARHRLTPRTDLVDDVVQDVFLAALNGLGAFQGQSSLRTWLIAIARHKIDDIYRQRLRLAETLDDLDSVADERLSHVTPLDERIDTRRMRAKTRRILAQLPEHYGLIVLWRYWEQRTTRDMAAVLGTTEKSVERTLARARERFRELWVKE